MGRPHLGDNWETSGGQLDNSGETLGNHIGRQLGDNSDTTSGRQVKDIWETNGRQVVSDTWGLWETTRVCGRQLEDHLDVTKVPRFPREMETRKTKWKTQREASWRQHGRHSARQGGMIKVGDNVADQGSR